MLKKKKKNTPLVHFFAITWSACFLDRASLTSYLLHAHAASREEKTENNSTETVHIINLIDNLKLRHLLSVAEWNEISIT